MKQTFNVNAGDFAAAGEVSSQIKKLLRHIGIDPNIIRRLSIASYEAEMNLIIHSYGGTMTFSISTEKIIITASDNGPGIKNIELAMREGYSTATEEIRELGFGAGMGLPNIKRCADEINIDSKVGQGTHLEIIFYLKKDSQ